MVVLAGPTETGSVAFFGNAQGNNSYTFGGSSKGRGSFTVEGVADDEGGIAMYGYTGGRYGVSIGGGTTGLGASSSREDYAVAIGWNSDARGQASIALGPSDAFGYNAFSTGWVTEARGNYSSTFGYRTNSYPYASMAIGRYNVITGDSASWVNADPIFMIGDGTSNTNRSNSFTILKKRPDFYRLQYAYRDAACLQCAGKSKQWRYAGPYSCCATPGNYHCRYGL